MSQSAPHPTTARIVLTADRARPTESRDLPIASRGPSSVHTGRAVALVLALTSCVAAQVTTVVPAATATTEGVGFDQRPFGLERIRLTQLIPFDRLGIAAGKKVTELAYRRDGTVLTTTALTRPATFAYSIRLGNLDTTVASGVPFDPRNPTGLFLSPGSGTNSLVEYFNAIPNWPALVTKPTGPADFDLRFKLVAPFVVQGPSGIAIDHYVYGSTNASYNYYVDIDRSSVDHGKATRFGSSCPVDDVDNRAYAIPSNPGGAPIEASLFGAVPSTLAVLVVGASNTTWTTLPLPLRLDGLGLTGCAIHVSQDILLSMYARVTGSARALLDVPADPTLAGALVYTQWMTLDARLNPSLPFTFSGGVEIRLGTTIGSVATPFSILYGTRAVARQRYGLVETGLAFVTQFVHD
ncbi:MAG: hypothetical protein H6832_13735 [Planctomycetes bacterium]|nr:hypothetical protein [Planctomycetota bacterium]MCB9891283.1 hypothetical protein [Planctomycetota bacterium]MCB9919458.1 hypothetical protein [Planctomycetota bacterium]